MELNEDYPSAWSFDEYMSIKSAKGRQEYAKKHLKKLGCGSSRCAFEVDGERVLKIVKSMGDRSKGIAQNAHEVDVESV